MGLTVGGAPPRTNSTERAEAAAGQNTLDRAANYSKDAITGKIRDESIMAVLRASKLAAQTVAGIGRGLALVGRASSILGIGSLLLGSSRVVTGAEEEKQLRRSHFWAKMLAELEAHIHVLQDRVARLANQKASDTATRDRAQELLEQIERERELLREMRIRRENEL